MGRMARWPQSQGGQVMGAALPCPCFKLFGASWQLWGTAVAEWQDWELSDVEANVKFLETISGCVLHLLT